MTDTAALISELGRDLRPVRRLRPPAWRAALWLSAAVAVTGLLVLRHGLRPDLAGHFAQPGFVLEFAGEFATAIGAALGAFYLSVPGRSRLWALAAAPGALLWLSEMGYGCWSDWLTFGPDGLALGPSFACFEFIATTTIPLSAALLFLLRYAAPVRPATTAMFATLSVASLAAAGQSLMHGLDTSIMILVWHLGSVAILLALARFAGPRLLQRYYEPPAETR
jgi:hypothetical protein